MKLSAAMKKHFTCPGTGEIMSNPVVAPVTIEKEGISIKKGVTYDASFLKQHFPELQPSPYPNRVVKDLIEYYYPQSLIPKEEEEEEVTTEKNQTINLKEESVDANIKEEKKEDDNQGEYASIVEALSDIVRCSYTLCVLVNPVIAPEGHSFEKSEIEKDQKKLNALTRKAFTAEDLIPNLLVYEIITTLLEENNIDINEIDKDAMVKFAFERRDLLRLKVFLQKEILKPDDFIFEFCNLANLTTNHIEWLLEQAKSFDLLEKTAAPILDLLTSSCKNGLIKTETLIKLKDKNDNTPLHFAKDDLEVFLTLLFDGSNPFVPNKLGVTPLQLLPPQKQKVVEDTISYFKKSFLKSLYLLQFEKLQEIVKKYPYLINLPIDDHGNTPLDIATSLENEKLLTILLENGADANQKNKDGKTPLHSTIIGGNLQVTKLLSGYTDFSKPDKWGDYPIHIAASHKQKDIVKFFVEEKKQDINQPNNTNFTSLEMAFMHSDETLIDFLLKLGAKSVFSTTTLIHSAAQKGHLSVVKICIENNISPELVHLGVTPMHEAAAHGQLEIIKLLMTHGANINTKAGRYKTPICRAIKTQPLKFIEELVTLGASLNVTDILGRNLLHIAIDDKTEHLETIKYLLQQQDIDINCSDLQRRSPLTYAVKRKFSETVKLLILQGADPYITPEEPHTIVPQEKRKSFKFHAEVQTVLKILENRLITAIQNDHLVLIQEILANYPYLPEITFEKDENSLIQLAINHSTNITTIQWFVDNFKDQILTSNKLGDHALHSACKKGNIEVIKILLSLKLNFQQFNLLGRKPLYYIATYHVELITQLRQIDKSFVDPSTHVDEKNNTLWHLAAMQGTLLVEELKKIPVDPCFKPPFNKAGDTPLHVAIECNNKAFIEIMHEHSPEQFHTPNQVTNQTLLSLAIQEKEADLAMDLLVNTKCDPLQKNANGKNSLHLAIEIGLNEISSEILNGQYNLDINETDNDGNTYLHLAALYDNEVEVDHLLYRGANPTIKNKNNETAADLAAKNKTINVFAEHFNKLKNQLTTSILFNQFTIALELLVKNLHLFDYFHTMDWPEKAELDQENFIIALISEPNSKNLLVLRDLQGNNLLHWSAENNWSTLAELLLSRGSDINATNPQGMTPLHLAVTASHFDMIKFLLIKGADLTIQDQTGKTAEEFANGVQKNEIVALLRILAKAIAHSVMPLDTANSLRNLINILVESSSVKTKKILFFTELKSELQNWFEQHNDKCLSILKTQEIDLNLAHSLYYEIIMLAYIGVIMNPEDSLANKIIKAHYDNVNPKPQPQAAPETDLKLG